jgi:N-acetylneuraminic acid mutarotase
MNHSRAGFAVVAVNGKIYAIGGYGKSGESVESLGVVEAYDPSLDVWESLPAMPTARAHFSCNAIGANIYVIGGVFPRVEVFNTNTKKWTEKEDLPRELAGHKGVVVGNMLWLLGGNSKGDSREVLCYDPRLDKWEPEGVVMNNPRNGLACVILNNYVFAIGGSNGEALKTVEYCSVAGGKWFNSTPLPAPRLYHEAVVLNGRIYVIGGDYVSDVNTVYEGSVAKDE